MQSLEYMRGEIEMKSKIDLIDISRINAVCSDCAKILPTIEVDCDGCPLTKMRKLKSKAGGD